MNGMMGSNQPTNERHHRGLNDRTNERHRGVNERINDIMGRPTNDVMDRTDVPT